MRTALSWCSKYSILVIPCRRFGTTNRPHLQGKNSWILKIGSIGFPETSVRYYNYTLCNIPEERSSYILRNGSLNSRFVSLIAKFSIPGTNQLLASSLSLCLTLLKSRPQILIILYSCTVPTCRITAVSYLPTPLNFLIRS